MAAPMNQYRDEFISAYEFGETLLRQTVTTEWVNEGGSAVFLVAGTGGTEATTRGINGDILYGTDDLNQLTATLREWDAATQRTRFDIFTSQGPGRQIMYENVWKKINRKIDSLIITELDTATNDTGAATAASLSLVMKARAILGNNEVPVEEADDIFGLVTPAFMAYLMMTPEFASADYVDTKPLAGPARKMLRWAGVNWIEHPRLPGAGTSAEHCFIYHRSAIGHAMAVGDINFRAGYEEKHDRSWARAIGFMGSKLLQNKGVVVLNHDGSAFVAS